jgi:hypothetical protein
VRCQNTNNLRKFLFFYENYNFFNQILNVLLFLILHLYNTKIVFNFDIYYIPTKISSLSQNQVIEPELAHWTKTGSLDQNQLTGPKLTY